MTSTRLVRFCLIVYTLFLLATIPYIRLFQDFIKTNDYTGLYDSVLWTLVGLLIVFILYSLAFKGRKGLRDLSAYAVVGLVFGAALMMIGETVERMHFIQYGILVLLVFLELRPRIGDASVYLFALLAGTAVGILDEWIQWWVPTRFGELRDIGLNVMASLLAVLCILLLWRPADVRLTLPAARIRVLMWVMALLIVEVTGFISCAHLGHLNHDPDIGTFRSQYTASELTRLSRERSYPVDEQIKPLRIDGETKKSADLADMMAMWRKNDIYRTEAEFRVGSRNRHEREGRTFAAWAENEIVERYFTAAVRDSSMRWSNEQRSPLERVIQSRLDAGERFTSPVYPHLWTSVTLKTLWFLCTLAVAACMLIARQFSHREE